MLGAIGCHRPSPNISTPPTPIKLGPPVFGSAIVERLAVRLMVAMCYQLSDRVVDELINELEAMQHA